MLEIIDLAKRYGPVVALDGASLHRPARAASSASSGPNGAGKTTTMRCIFGLARPDRGEVRWKGAAGRSRGAAALRLHARAARPVPADAGRRAAQLLRPAARAVRHATPNAAAARWLERMGLGDRAKSKLEELSHGNQQRVQLAAALVHDPELLVLDEPFSGLDPIGIATMTEVLRERAAAGVGVVFSSHQLDLVEDVCEDVVIIARGRIVAAGAIDELKARVGPAPPRGRGRRLGRRLARRRRPTSPSSSAAGDRVKLLVADDVDLDALLARARAAGEVRTFAYQPPKLSELFMEAVTPAEPSPSGGRAMSRWRSVWLVARREILERGRSRGFILSVVFTTAARRSARSSCRPSCSATSEADEARRRRARRRPASSGAIDRDRAASSTRTSRSCRSPTRRPPRPALEPASVDAVVDVPADLSVAGRRSGSTRSPTRPSPSSSRPRSIGAAAAGRPRPTRASTRAPSPPPSSPRRSTPLDPQTEADEARFLFANIGAVLILVGIFSFGFTVLTGVVEEKQSRVVEVVLVDRPAARPAHGQGPRHRRPRPRPAGRVRGRRRSARRSVTDRFVAARRRPRRAIVLLVVWFILGYALYSTALGFLGALASRMEEASNASTPVTMVAMVSYFVAIFAVIDDPTGTRRPDRHVPAAVGAVRRAAAGRVRCDRAVGDRALGRHHASPRSGCCSSSAARVYAGAVLQTAGRMKLRDAWRSAGE